jgi:hypothetical protein
MMSSSLGSRRHSCAVASSLLDGLAGFFDYFIAALSFLLVHFSSPQNSSHKLNGAGLQRRPSAFDPQFDPEHVLLKE